MYSSGVRSIGGTRLDIPPSHGPDTAAEGDRIPNVFDVYERQHFESRDLEQIGAAGYYDSTSDTIFEVYLLQNRNNGAKTLALLKLKEEAPATNPHALITYIWPCDESSTHGKGSLLDERNLHKIKSEEVPSLFAACEKPTNAWGLDWEEYQFNEVYRSGFNQ